MWPKVAGYKRGQNCPADPLPPAAGAAAGQGAGGQGCCGATPGVQNEDCWWSPSTGTKYQGTCKDQGQRVVSIWHHNLGEAARVHARRARVRGPVHAAAVGAGRGWRRDLWRLLLQLLLLVPRLVLLLRD